MKSGHIKEILFIYCYR